jgi:hypothetical protein
MTFKESPRCFSPRRELKRFPDIELMDEFENKAMLGIRLHFGDLHSRKEILEKNLVPRSTFDRAIVAFNHVRRLGKIGKPDFLSEAEEGLLLNYLDGELALGHLPKCSMIRKKVFYSIFHQFLHLFSPTGRRHQKFFPPTLGRKSQTFKRMALSMVRSISTVQSEDSNEGSCSAMALFHEISSRTMV